MNRRAQQIIILLLFIIGILCGSLLTLYWQQSGSDLAKVKVTEISRSSSEWTIPDSIQATDPRFLFKTVARNVTPTVVYIESIVPVQQMEMPEDGNHDFDDSFWDRFFPERRARTVGSGVLISKDGYILTNNHVVDGAEEGTIRVTLFNKEAYQGRIVGTDPNTDLAVVKVDGSDFPNIVIGNSDRVEVGEWVLAIGNPFRLRSTVTAGIVSALSRQVQVINERMSVESFIQTDAAINRGNSGGALVNAGGELIGINTAIATETGNYQGYGFAVPANLAMKVARDIIEFGEVQRALLGVSIDQVDYDRARQLELSEVRGVEIVGILDGGAASEYGLEVNDVIISVNDHPVNEVSELQERVALQRPGDTARVMIVRDGRRQSVEVVLRGMDQMGQLASADEQRLDQQPRDDESMDWERYGREGTGVEYMSFSNGFTVMALAKAEDLERYDLVISRVDEESDAWEEGIREGQQILAVDGETVEDLDRFKDLVLESREGEQQLTITLENRDRTRMNIKLSF